MGFRILNDKIVKRWNGVMCDIGCEYLTINTIYSELESQKTYYGIETAIDIEWLYNEAYYWYDCYREPGNCRYDDRLLDKESYKMWLSERGKLKRLLQFLSKYVGDHVVAVWEE